MAYWIIAAIVLFDQATKWLMTAWLAPSKSVPLIQNVLHFTYTTNKGAAWGILKDNRWIFMTISILAIVAILAYLIYDKQLSRGLRLALAFICGGGVGNMIDRIFLGEVVDFIDFCIIDFPCFNVADSFICIGAVLFAYFFIKEEFTREKQAKTLSKPEQTDQTEE